MSGRPLAMTRFRAPGLFDEGGAASVRTIRRQMRRDSPEPKLCSPAAEIECRRFLMPPAPACFLRSRRDFDFAVSLRR